MPRGFIRGSFVLVCLLAAVGARAQLGEPVDQGDTSEPAASPGQRLVAADDLRISGRYEEAIGEYVALVAVPEHRLAATLGRAECLRRMGSYTEALAALDDSSDLGSASADWHVQVAEVMTLTGRYANALEQARQAIVLDGDHVSAHYLRGRLLETLGRRDDAIDAYRWFEDRLVRGIPTTAPQMTTVALGYHRHGELTRTDRSPYALHELLQAAYTRVDRTYWPARMAAGDLLRRKDQYSEALGEYEAALSINPNAADAHAGVGAIALRRWDFDTVEQRVTQALNCNPNCAAAFNLQAASKTIEKRYDEALEAAAKSLAINPHDLEALSRAAAAALAKGDIRLADEFKARVSAINPKCAVLSGILADSLTTRRRFADAEREYREAISFDPTDAPLRSELGLMYMQWGREEDARVALESSWQLDRSNARTLNTLKLLEQLEGFDRIETDHFEVRFDGDLDAAMAPYASRYLESIYDEFVSDYDVEPAEKTIIEIFPTHRAFGVRITGQPWIHTIGASTGRVIAIDSARQSAQATGPYHYARVLRHEFTHTITLAASDNRIPHWFTEGLAVLQEDAPRSFDWCQLLAEAIRRDQLFTLESIDWGFIRPRRPSDRQLAYAQSEWICEYLVERFGYSVLNAMIGGFREAKTPEAIFREHTGVGMIDFDRSFVAWASRQAAGWGFDLQPPENPDELRAATTDTPDDAELQARLAKAELDAGNIQRALAAARTALRLDEDELVALNVLGTVLHRYWVAARDPGRRRKLEQEALSVLARVARAFPEGWSAVRLLAEIHLHRGDTVEAERWFRAAQQRCPMDPASYRALAGIYLDAGRIDSALPQLLELARREANDPDVPAQIAGIYESRDRLTDAAYWCGQAIFIDPFDSSLHEKRAAVCERVGMLGEALAEFEALCTLDPSRADYRAHAARLSQGRQTTAPAEAAPQESDR